MPLSQCATCGRELHSPLRCPYCERDFCRRHQDPGQHECPERPRVSRRRAIKIGLALAFGSALGTMGLRLARVPIPGLPPPPVRRDRFVFQPDPAFPMNHASTLAEAPNGDVLVAWYSGSREKGPDVAIYSSRLPKGSESWSAPEKIADTEEHSEGNPVLWTSPDGSVWLFYVTMYGYSWNDCKIKYKVSEDEGRSWGEEKILREELGWMTRNPPLVLNDQEVLLPVYDEVNWHSMVIITSDDFETWRAFGDLSSPGGAIQPSVIRRDDGSLLMYMRTDSDRIYMSESRDEGRSWTPATPTNLKNPNAAVTLLKLQSGRVALAFNDSESGRSPLNIALSTNDGARWRYNRFLEDEGGSFSYPSLVQTSDGLIHIAYTYNRDTVKHVVTNETWISGGL